MLITMSVERCLKMGPHAKKESGPSSEIERATCPRRPQTLDILPGRCSFRDDYIAANNVYTGASR